MTRLSGPVSPSASSIIDRRNPMRRARHGTQVVEKLFARAEAGINRTALPGSLEKFEVTRMIFALNLDLIRVESQRAQIAELLFESAGLNTRSIDVLEPHNPGTPQGSGEKMRNPGSTKIPEMKRACRGRSESNRHEADHSQRSSAPPAATDPLTCAQPLF